ncbi:acetyl ornithine aminotransferase family protein [Nitrospira defluvii]|nr:acetyl ornithine aminotransferase family protein [Nitrospira defluvii]
MNVKKFSKRPGPKAKKWVQRDHAVISPSVTRSYPLVVDSAKGSIITDVDGNRYLDFTSGIAVTASGHCHPKVTKAITTQAKRLIHMSGTDFYYPSEVNLAEVLTSLTPGRSKKKVFFTNSGAESVEAAMKLTRYYTNRPYYLAFTGAFHGRTLGALSLTASKALQKKGFAPLIPGVIHAPYPNPYRPPRGLSSDQVVDFTMDWIEETAFRHLVPPEEVAAIFVEPIQGEGGYIVPPDHFLKELAKLAKSYGIVLVVDEIQTGMGRTGKMFASEHFGYSPEVMTLAKGIASGLPLGALIANTKIMNAWESGSHANTFGGNPIACEAALATIDLLKNGLMKNAEYLGNFILDRLLIMQKNHRLMGDVRGIGLMIGVELVRDRETKEMAISERDIIVHRCFEKGLLLLGCGKNVIRFVPPLTLKRKEAEEGLSIFDAVLTEVERKKN